jgi:hypothetical protein
VNHKNHIGRKKEACDFYDQITLSSFVLSQSSHIFAALIQDEHYLKRPDKGSG